MQLNPHDHIKKQQLVWDPSKLQITLKNLDQSKIYLLFTNSLKIISHDEVQVQSKCEGCNQKIFDRVFNLKANKIEKQELLRQLVEFKYAVLPFKNNSCRIDHAIGYKSYFFEKKSTLVTNNLIISSQKVITESQQFDRALYCTMASHESKQSEPNQEIVVEDLSSSIVFSLSKDLQVTEKYDIYVTKLQKQIGYSYRNNMSYEYAWTEAQIEFVMKKIQKMLGSIQSLILKQKYLCFTFTKNKNDFLFKNKYDNLCRQLLFQQHLKIQGNALSYYLVSKQQLLHNQALASKIFLLPNNEKITDMLMVNQWVIISAETYLLFVHNERPMEFFYHEQNIIEAQLSSHTDNNNLVIAADKRGQIYFYSLQDTQISLIAKYNVVFVTPYCLVHLGTEFAIAGIDIESSKSHSTKQSRRSIYIVNINEKGNKHDKLMQKERKNKPLTIEMRLQVVVIPQHQNAKPIQNLKQTKEKGVLACTWNNKFYLVSLQGYKLIEVQMKTSIVKLLTIPFLFNLLNFILLNESGELVRVGIQCYGEGLGAELSQLKFCQAKDCVFSENISAKFEVYTCNNKTIDLLSYLKQSKQRFLQEENGKILKMASFKSGMAYLLDLEHSIELKFIQI